jgi:hypothetical protein
VVDLAPAVDTRPASQVTPADASISAPDVKLLGGGFCAVNPVRGSKPGLFTLFLVGALGTLVVRRRRR